MEILYQLSRHVVSFLNNFGADLNLLVDSWRLPFPKTSIFLVFIFFYLIVKIFSGIVRSLDAGLSRLSHENKVGSVVHGLAERTKYLSDAANLSRAVATHREFSQIKDKMLSEHLQRPELKLSFKRRLFNILRLVFIIIFLFLFFIFPWTLGDQISPNAKLAYSFFSLFLALMILWWGGDIGKY